MRSRIWTPPEKQIWTPDDPEVGAVPCPSWSPQRMECNTRGLAIGIGLNMVMGGQQPDPKTIFGSALKLWLRDYPTFTGTEHWVGTDPTQARNIYHGASSPSSGNFLNGHQTATFDGSFNSDNSQEGSGEHLDQTISVSAWSFACLCNASAAAAPSGSGPRFDAALVDDSGGTFWQINYNTNGYVLTVVDGGGAKSCPAALGLAAPTGQWHLVQAYGDGVNIGARIDGAAFTTVACGAINDPLTTRYFRVGDNFGGTHWPGQMAEILAGNTVWTLSQFDQLKVYINSRYGLAL